MTRTKTNLTVKIISFLLTLILVFYAIPSIVYAEAIDALGSLGGEESETDVRSAAISDKNAYEMSNLRTESTKTFKLPDGSFVAAQYPSAVHRKDSDGAWQDIDNSLAASGSEISTKDARVKFAKKITGNETLFTLHENNTKITFSLNGAIKKTKGEVIKLAGSENAEDTELSKLMTLENLSSKIVYANILDGVDLEYVLNSNNIKENIIVKEKKESYVYSFEIKLNNLLAELSGKDILIKNAEGETAYVIPAPIIFDSNGVYAPESVGSYALISHGNGSYTLTVTADALWMNSAERAFPITVDPTVSPEAENTDLNIRYINREGMIEDGQVLRVCNDEHGFKQGITYLKFSNFDFLPRNAYVSSAKLSLLATSGYSGYVGLYKVVNDWSTKIYSLGNNEIQKPPISYAKILDTNNIRADFDITELLKIWLLDSDYNKGCALQVLDDTRGEVVFEDPMTSAIPILTVNFTNVMGLEDYLTYSSHSIGKITGNINVATGNLTLTIPTLSTKDNILPYTPTLVYNGAMAGRYNLYPNAQVPYSSPISSNGFKWNIQQTVIKKTYVEDGISKDYYIWSDEDGTEHSFYKDENSNFYHDEDGLLLKMTVSNSSVTITDKNQNKLNFERAFTERADISHSYKMTSFSDSIGNRIEFWGPQSNGSVLSVRLIATNSHDSSYVHTTPLVLECEANGTVKYIYDSDTGKAVILKYSTDYNGEIINSAKAYLREIIYATKVSDTATTWEMFRANEEDSEGIKVTERYNITYNSYGLITSVHEEISDQTIKYEYGSKKVIKVSQIGKNDSVGIELEYDYQYCYSEIISKGNDALSWDDIFTRYIFDESGRVVSTYSYSNEEDRFLLGGMSGVYETQENVKNNLASTAQIGGTAVNNILNGGFENNFFYWQDRSNVSLIESDTSDYEGNRCARFEYNAYISQEVYLIEGQYTLSFNANSTYSYGSELTVTVVSLTDEDLYLDEDVKVYQNSGRRISFTFNVDHKIRLGDRVKIKIKGSYCDIDKIMLEEGACTSTNYSLVNAGRFEVPQMDENGNSTLSLSNFWQVYGQEYRYNVSAHKAFCTNITLNGNLWQPRLAVQRIYQASDKVIDNYKEGIIGASERHTYKVSGFAYSTAPVKSEDATFRLLVEVGYIQKDSEEKHTVTYAFDFLSGCKNWQFISGVFSTELEGELNETYGLVEYIDLCCEFSYQTGSAEFDNFSVVCCDGEILNEYEYYENGLLKSVSNSAGAEYYYYDSEDNLVKLANNNGEIYEYTYNQNRTVASETYSTFTVNESGETNYPAKEDDPESLISKTLRIKSDYLYNVYGQQISSETYTDFAEGTANKAENAKVVVLTREYGTNPKFLGALISETDTLGTTVRYYYDSNDGKLLAKINENSGEGVCYTYDTLDRIIAVRPASYLSASTYSDIANGEEVEYNYNAEGALSSIITETTSYSFSYDDFGNTASVSAGDNKVVEYSYDPIKGRLSSLSYANNYTEEYYYNVLDLLDSIWYYNDEGVLTKQYSYKYTTDGKIASIHNYLTGQITEYSYTVGGQLSCVTVLTEGTSAILNKIEYEYNDKNELVAVNYRNVSSEFTYMPDGKVASVIINGYPSDNIINYTYDSFNRVTRKTHTGENFTNIVDYTYKETQANTSGQIESYTSTVNGIIVTYTYTYDDNGNITKINIGTGTEIRYVYDDLGQLIREDNSLLGYTYIYTYDNSGNIVSSSKYEMTDADTTPSNAIDSKTYEYSQDAWGDMLTSYNGHEITYDELGNPLTYYNGKNYTFTWRGRQMVSLTKDGVTYSFEYDDAGNRVKKKVGDSVTYYYYSGDLLIAEESDNRTVVYLYDNNAVIIGYRLDNVEYFYDKNIQGDVVAVYNSLGERLISYTYDAWGNATANYADSAENLYNPFGYRGYYYDYDVDLYYLGTRYYDSVTGRFLSPDTTAVLTATPMALTHKNLYAYCDNNPITRVDHGGEFWEDVVVDVYECERFDVGGLGGPLGSAYSNYVIRTKTAIYDASRGGCYHSGFSSAMKNLSAYYVPGAVSVTDDMADAAERVYIQHQSPPKEYIPMSEIHWVDSRGLKQVRFYGRDGKATVDIDFRHGGANHKFPHVHIWDYNNAADPRLHGITEFKYISLK